jgi:hypothetical protein
MKRLVFVILALAAGIPAAAQGVRKTADEFNKMSSSDTSLVELHGVVSRMRSNPRGVFWLKDETGEAYIYGLVDGRPGSDVSFVQMQVVVGDTLTVVGRRTVYNGTTIEMAGGHCERIVGGQQLAILHGLCGVVDKLAEETGLSFGKVLADLKEYRKALGKLNGGDAARMKQ